MLQQGKCPPSWAHQWVQCPRPQPLESSPWSLATAFSAPQHLQQRRQYQAARHRRLPNHPPLAAKTLPRSSLTSTRSAPASQNPVDKKDFFYDSKTKMKLTGASEDSLTNKSDLPMTMSTGSANDSSPLF